MLGEMVLIRLLTGNHCALQVSRELLGGRGGNPDPHTLELISEPNDTFSDHSAVKLEIKNKIKKQKNIQFMFYNE